MTRTLDPATLATARGQQAADPLLVALITLGDPSQLTGGYLFHRRLADLAPEENARIEFVSFPARPFPLAVVDAPRVLLEARATGAAALVLDSIAAAFVGPLLSRKGPGVPMLGMLHQPPGGIDHGPARTALQAALDRLAYAHVLRLLVASDSLYDAMLADGTPPDRMRVVPPGRDVAGAPADVPGDLRRGRQAGFVCVGNWVERKGILSLLEACALLPPPAVTLHLVGDTRPESTYGRRVQARLEQADLRDRVVVHGQRTTAEVSALYLAADAFVLPSLKEPYGTVYGEAMASGLPVVGWRAGNLPYLATHESEGLVIEPGDVAGLAAAMTRLADDPELRRRMGEAARLRALERPTWREVARLFFGEIREVLDQGA